MDINEAIRYFARDIDDDIYSSLHRTACKMAVDALRAQLDADHVRGSANMMPRMIDANELLKKKFLTREFDATARGWTIEVVSAKDIEGAPTIDSESLRPHGRWETSLVEADGVSMYIHFHNDGKCKYFYADRDCVGSRYCPNCGAKMGEEK